MACWISPAKKANSRHIRSTDTQFGDRHDFCLHNELEAFSALFRKHAILAPASLVLFEAVIPAELLTVELSHA